MKDNVLDKLGHILYWIYTLRNEKLTPTRYAQCCDKIYDTLLEIAPEPSPRQLDPELKEFVDVTNRRLNDTYKSN